MLESIHYWQENRRGENRGINVCIEVGLNSNPCIESCMPEEPSSWSGTNESILGLLMTATLIDLQNCMKKLHTQKKL